jgi:hypothetical protein
VVAVSLIAVKCIDFIHWAWLEVGND